MILIKKDSKGKVRCVNIWSEFVKPVYIIYRRTFQFGGKITEQPDITIEKGKAKRTLIQQADLELASNIKKYLDKGYKKYDELTKIPFDKITVEEITNLVGGEVEDQNGAFKPMLAKDYNKCATSALEQDWYASRKLDGVRCMMRWDKDEQCIKTSSRGGQDYDPSTVHIRTNPDLVELFKENPSIVLDGELYIHGRPLQYISGVARLKKEDPRTDELEYWVYDCIDTEDMAKPFFERLADLEYFDEEYLGEASYNKDGNVKIIPHKQIAGYLLAKKYHDKYVTEGFEGIILRDPDKEYGVNKRDNRMIKMKEYQDDEFKIIGWEEGLRPTEDMVFICLCAGKEFKAKPMGDRSVKAEYIANMDNIIGKMATVKFFAYTEDKIPSQPVLKSIREYGE